jgi:threonylcarbamoyladenosine tRNA methylthiotransferase MtaB
MKFYVDYFGCRSNQAEMQEWIHELENSGYELTGALSEADFGIINTCCVTEKAERDVFRFINRMYRNTTARWVIAGCSVSKEKQVLAGRFKNYFFFDNKEKAGLVDRIKELFPVETNLIYHTSFKSRVFLKVQDGCNFRCSFCIVPLLRGKSRSLLKTDVLGKARRYAALGYKEAVITGINLSSYGYDLFPRETLLSLIRDIHDVRGLDIIRLSSLDPRFIKYPFIKELSLLPKIADSFHFSIQSGSDSVLSRMKRGGKSRENMKILEYFREFYPQANLGADIIAGFPTESEREFKETLAFVQESPLNYLHNFPFSARSGTPAALMAGIPDEVVRRRIKELSEINTKKRMEFREKFRGNVLEGILVEENADYSLLLTRNYLSVRVPPLKGFKKKRVKVRITRMLNENLLEGQVV